MAAGLEFIRAACLPGTIRWGVNSLPVGIGGCMRVDIAFTRKHSLEVHGAIHESSTAAGMSVSCGA